MVIGRRHQIHAHVGARKVIDRQMPGLEQQMRIGAVGDGFAVEFDAHPARRWFEGDLVVGVGLEPGFARLRVPLPWSDPPRCTARADHSMTRRRAPRQDRQYAPALECAASGRAAGRARRFRPPRPVRSNSPSSRSACRAGGCDRARGSRQARPRAPRRRAQRCGRAADRRLRSDKADGRGGPSGSGRRSISPAACSRSSRRARVIGSRSRICASADLVDALLAGEIGEHRGLRPGQPERGGARPLLEPLAHQAGHVVKNETERAARDFMDHRRHPG